MITPDVDEGLAAAVSRAMRGDSVLEGKMSLGRDYESVAKWFECFMAPSLIRSENARVEVSGTADGLRIVCTLRGGTLREKQLFAEAMKELLSPVNNPRYVVVRRVLRVPQYSLSMACPSLLGNNKQNAELFQRELARQLGDMLVVYTRNEAGYAVNKKCVKRSFVNFEANTARSIVRKEVY